MKTTSELLDQILAYCSRRGIAETTFGRLAVNDGKLVSRLRSGRTVTLATLSRIQAVLESGEVAS
jgi:hypothetical protein